MTRFPAVVEAVLRDAGWHPGRRDMVQAEAWADQLSAHTSPGGHRHNIFPAAVEVWAEFGGLHIELSDAGAQVARSPFVMDPMCGLHMARTFAHLGRALDTAVCPLGEEAAGQATLAIDADGRVYSLDHTGDWFLGADIDQAMATLIIGIRPVRLTTSP